MKRVNGNNWKALLFLSIIIPMGLLTTFKFAGIISQPQITETIEQPIVTWNMPSPDQHPFLINRSLVNVYFDSVACINFSLFLWDYSTDVFISGDRIESLPSFSVSVSHGFVNSATIKFEIDNYSWLDIIEDPVGGMLSTENLHIISIEDGQGVLPSYVIAETINKPIHCLMELTVFWHLFDGTAYDHTLKSTLEVVYFDGQAYKKIILPIELEVSHE